MDDRPIISIIVPVYKTAKVLHRCMDSIINQTYTKLEIILINDGCPEGGGLLCDSYAEKDSRIKVFHQENMGLSMARNKGLEVASGDYIGFVDSDDYIELNMYETMLNALLQHNLRVVECCYEKDGSNRRGNSEELFYIQDYDNALKRIHIPGFYNVPNKLYERNLIKDIRFPKDQLYEDVMFTAEVWSKLDYIGYMPIDLYHYVQEGESIIRSSYSLKKLEGLWLKYQAFQKFEKICKSEESLLHLHKNLLNTLFFHYHSLLENRHLDPNRSNLRKIRSLFKKYCRNKFSNLYFTLIYLLPVEWYTNFFHVNKSRIRLQGQLKRFRIFKL